MLKISKGKQVRAQKVVIYGPEGVGKSTLSSDLPSPLFLDAEGGTDHLDCERVIANKMSDITNAVNSLQLDTQKYKTLILDTVDWVEKKMSSELCAKHNVDSIEKVEGGYGKGYTMLEESMMKFLSSLDRLREKGMHVVLLAHSKVQRHEDPELASSYDRYQLKLEKKTSALVKEWADALLFFNFVTKVTDRAGTMGSKRGVGGKERVLHTERTAAFDAKNRHNLHGAIKVPSENPASEISVIFENIKKQNNQRSELESILKSAGTKKEIDSFLKSTGKTIDGIKDQILKRPEKFIEAVHKHNDNIDLTPVNK